MKKLLKAFMVFILSFIAVFIVSYVLIRYTSLNETLSDNSTLFLIIRLGLIGLIWIGWPTIVRSIATTKNEQVIIDAINNRHMIALSLLAIDLLLVEGGWPLLVELVARLF